MTYFPEFTLAAIQAAPVYFDREASTEKACQLIEQAGKKGAALAAFGETWLSGYPFFTLYPVLTPLWNQAVAAYLANAVEIPSPTTDRLCEAALRGGIDVVIGIVELDTRTRGSVYCTLLFISRQGKILGRHRKLKPTLGERIVWADGDGVGLTVYDRPFGRLSGLSCGEHAMLLPAYALIAQGTQVHVAAWPFPGFVSESHPAKGLVMSQAIAIQGSCYVIATGSLMRPEDVPEPFRDIASEWGTAKDEGGSCIIAPGGDIIAAAPANKETILTATVSLERVLQLKPLFDIGAHYSRPDILQLVVNRRPFEAILNRNRSVSTKSPVVASDANADLGTNPSIGDNEQQV